MRRASEPFRTALVIAVCLWVCDAAAAQTYPPAVSHLVTAAKAQIKTIDMATFKGAYDKSSVGLLIDVREPEEYANGFIPGAINVPRGVIELRIWAYVGFPDKTDLSKKMTLYWLLLSHVAVAPASAGA